MSRGKVWVWGLRLGVSANFRLESEREGCLFTRMVVAVAMFRVISLAV